MIDTVGTIESEAIGDDAFDALASEYRRQLLIELLDRDRKRVSALTGTAAEIAAADEDLLAKHLSGTRAISGVDEDLLRAHHVHLPKLDDYGFVEWDPDDRTVTTGPRFGEVRPLLEFVVDRREADPPVRIGAPARR